MIFFKGKFYDFPLLFNNKNKLISFEVHWFSIFLADEITAMRRLEVILALGGLAHGAVVVALGHRKSAWKFGHNRRHDLPSLPILFNSYHCSRYNTNTGRLTPRMKQPLLQYRYSGISPEYGLWWVTFAKSASVNISQPLKMKNKISDEEDISAENLFYLKARAYFLLCQLRLYHLLLILP